MAIRIVSLTAKLGMDGTQFQQGLTKAGAQMRQFAGSLKSQLGGVFGAVAISTAMREVVKYGGAIADLAKKVGVSTDALQEFEFAGKAAGASLDDIGNALRGLAKARDDALGGNAEKLAAFGSLGIGKDALKNQSLETTFKQVASAFQRIDFGADELALVEKVLGRTGGVLIPVFKDGLEQAGENARKLGIIISQDVVQSLDEAGDAMDRLAARSRKPVAQMTANLANFAGKLVHQADQSFGGFGAWLGGLIHTPGGIRERLRGAREQEQAHLADINAAPAAAPERTQRAVNRAIEVATKAMAKRALVFPNIASTEITDFRSNLNVGDLGRKGAFGGLSVERAFGLQGKKDKSVEIERNTKATVEGIRTLNQKIGQLTGMELDF